MISRALYSIYTHFYRHTFRKPWDFCWRITIEETLVKFLMTLFIFPFYKPGPQPLRFDLLDNFVYAVIIAPLVETLIFQSFIITVSQKFKRNFSSQIMFSTVAFTAAHLLGGMEAAITAGLVGGFYLSFTYAHWSKQSHFLAFQITAGTHALGNALLLVLIALLMFISGKV
jgi:hypothetical protein